MFRSVKESARSMKTVNIMLNCLVTLSAYALLPELVKLCKQQYNKLFILSTCLLFSLHPVHTEPVISIVGRADLLAALFFIQTCLFALWFNPNSFIGVVFKHFIISLLSFVSMLCKEQGILVLLFVFPLLLVQNEQKMFSKKNCFLILFVITNIFFFSWFRLRVGNFQFPKFQRGDNPTAFEAKFLDRILSFNYINALNLVILICPIWLCFDWALGCIPPLNPLDSRVCFVFGFWFILFLFLVKIFFQVKSGEYFLGLAMGLLTIPFLLCLNIFVNVGFVIAERNLFLPLLGYSLLYHIGLTTLTKHVKTKLVYVFHTILLILILLRTCNRSSAWKQENILYRTGLAVCPGNGKVYYNIAKLLDQENKRSQAILFYSEAVRLGEILIKGQGLENSNNIKL